MRINKFKGLYTNVDSNDIKPEYLQKALNLNVTDKALETRFYESSQITIPSEIIKVLAYEAIELDNDKLQSIVVDDEAIPTYQYNIERKYLLIGNTVTTTKFFLDGIELTIPITKLFTKATVYQDKGFVLILLDDETYWLGKLNRNVWRNGLLVSYNEYYLDRYLEPFDKNNLDVTYENSIAKCKNNRRLGFGVKTEIITEQNTPLEERPCTFTLLDISTKDNPGTYVSRNEILKVSELIQGQFKYAVFNCKTDKNQSIYSPYSVSREYHIFNLSQNEDFIIVPYFYFHDEDGNKQNFKLADGTFATDHWSQLSNQNYDTLKDSYGTEIAEIFGSAGYSIPVHELANFDFVDIGTTSIDNNGFLSSLKNYELVVSSVLDAKEEIITEVLTGKANVTDVDRYALKTKTTIAIDANKRLTGINYYIRFDETVDFIQVKSVNLLNHEESEHEEFLFGEISENKIELVQTIGTLFNMNSYFPIHAFSLFNRISNIPYMVKDNQLYSAVTGSGKLLDLFYPENRIPEITDREITYVSNLNNIPAVHDVEKTTLLVPIDSRIGALYFKKRDQIGFSIKNQYDIAVSPDGVAIHTHEGIYLYNGTNIIPISEQINDIIESNFSTGKIFYNSFAKELYYVKDSEFDEFYRYSFVQKEWTSHLLPETISALVLQNTAIDHNGNLLIIANEQIFRLNQIHEGKATVELPESDYGRAREIKEVHGFRFDFIGSIICEGKEYNSNSRIIRTHYIAMHNRIPTEKIQLSFEMVDDTKLYNLEVLEETIYINDDFALDVIEAEEVIEEEAIEEGFSLYTEDGIPLLFEDDKLIGTE